MEDWEYIIITVTFLKDLGMVSISLNGETIFPHTSTTMALKYLQGYRSEGWEVIRVIPMGFGEIYNLKRRIIHTLIM